MFFAPKPCNFSRELLNSVFKSETCFPFITSLNFNSIKNGFPKSPKLNLVIPKVSSDLNNISGV